MADKGTQNAAATEEGTGVPTIQTLNVVPQKVIQIDKPTGYYGDKER